MLHASVVCQASVQLGKYILETLLSLLDVNLVLKLVLDKSLVMLKKQDRLQDAAK